jgi:hypothetical protein
MTVSMLTACLIGPDADRAPPRLSALQRRLDAGANAPRVAYHFRLPNTSFNRSVTRAAGLVLIFFSSWAIM